MATNLPVPANSQPNPTGSASWQMSTWRQARLILAIGFSQLSDMATLRERITSTGLPIVWVNLVPDDNFPRSFYEHLVRGIATVFQNSDRFSAWEWGEKIPSDVEEWMAGLINGCSDLEKEFFLVLDHYDQIDKTPIHQALMLWLDYLPPQTTIVLVTSIEPPLPLAHLRVRSQMIEIRL